MGIISVTSSGNTNNLDRFLREMKANSMFQALDAYGREGVAALESATPKRSGLAAGSWYYEITQTNGQYKISWLNSDRDSQGVPIVVLIQFGHGTGTGGYVPGVDFINPATKQVFDDVTDAVWKAVQSA